MLMKAHGWRKAADLNFRHLSDFDYLEDLNDRRIRDAEVVGAACRNGKPKVILEIGTGQGHMTAVMARNAPHAAVYTVNIPPEEVGQGGRLVTGAPSREKIGCFYRELGLQNIHQIYANTATWSPDVGPIDVAFIDGCHDAEFVYNDTRKVLEHCQPGSVVLWHDFAPELACVHAWIREVCNGVEQLFTDGVLAGRILHLQDSWVGLYRVPGGKAD